MNSNQHCLFCKIVNGSIPSPRIYEDDSFICIRDIHPQAKIHFLVIPKDHVPSLDEAFPEEGVGQSKMIGKLFEVATKTAREQGLLPSGFRAIVNTGREGGQTVFHLHLHIMGGDSLGEKF